MPARSRWGIPAALLPPGLRRGDPLGEGVWGRLATRCERSARRFRQVCEGAPDGDGRDQLLQLADQLDQVAADVRARCLLAHHEAPSAGLDVPRGPAGRHAQVHRELSRAITACAQAGEAAAMARVALGAGDLDTAARRIEAARRAAVSAAAQVAGVEPESNDSTT